MTTTTELYDEQYYLTHLGNVPYCYKEPWLSFFSNVAKNLNALYHPKTVLDAGCAIGLLVKSWQDIGVTCGGIDISHYAIGETVKHRVKHCVQGSLTDLSDYPKVDLITCIEVLEHIPAELEDIVIEQLCNTSDRIVFSSTSTDFEEKTHVNVCTQDHWIASFARHGFALSGDNVGFICPWAKVFCKSERGFRAVQDTISPQ